MYRLIKIIALCFIISVTGIIAQTPSVSPGEWQEDASSGFSNTQSDTAKRPQLHAVSNEMGIHTVVRYYNGSTLVNQYRLIGNDGGTYLTSTLDFTNNSDLKIAAVDEDIYVFTIDQSGNGNLVGKKGVLSFTAANQPEVTWTNLLSSGLPSTSARITDLAVNDVGVHIVYEDSGSAYLDTDWEVHYILYRFSSNS